MSKGTVKFFNNAKGFGFITEEGVDKDHFVHVTGLIDEIREGDDVEFELENSSVTYEEEFNLNEYNISKSSLSSQKDT